MNNLPKQFQNKVDDLAVDLIGEDHVTVRNGLIEFAQEYAKYRLEEFIADHFPEDSPKRDFPLTEEDCKELDDCLNDMFRKAYKTGINIPKEDELPKPPLKSKYKIEQPILIEVEIDGKRYKLPEGTFISRRFIRHFTE